MLMLLNPTDWIIVISHQILLICLQHVWAMFIVSSCIALIFPHKSVWYRWHLHYRCPPATFGLTRTACPFSSHITEHTHTRLIRSIPCDYLHRLVVLRCQWTCSLVGLCACAVDSVRLTRSCRPTGPSDCAPLGTAVYCLCYSSVSCAFSSHFWV